MNWQEIFVYYCMIPIVWLIGITGSLLGLIVFYRKSMNKIGPVLIYRLLFISDLVFLIQLINNYLTQTGNISGLIYSDVSCKIFSYFNFVTFNWSAFLMIYISIEKLVSIRYPAKRFILRKKKYQILYFIIVAILNLCVNVPVILYFKVNVLITYDTKTNSSRKLTYCLYNDQLSQQVITIIYLISGFLIPMSVMFISSILLIIKIFKLRQRVIQNFLSHSIETNDIKRYQKDIRIGVTSIIVNFTYLILNGPFAVNYALPNNTQNPLLFRIFANIFFFSFALNFYLILFTNLLTRNEFLSLFGKNKKSI